MRLEDRELAEAEHFPVEIHIDDEYALTGTMAGMREWLDHHRFEPSVFRHTFAASGVALHIEFAIKAEAEAFAAEFRGKVLASFAETNSAEAGSVGFHNLCGQVGGYPEFAAVTAS